MPVERLQRILARVAAAARRYDTSSLAVLGRMVALRARRGLRLEEAYLAGVLDPRLSPERVADFVGRDEFLSTLRPFNAGPKELVDDKAVFALYAESLGLAIPRTLALVAPPSQPMRTGARCTPTTTGFDRFASRFRRRS